MECYISKWNNLALQNFYNIVAIINHWEQDKNISRKQNYLLQSLFLPHSLS